MNRTPTDGPAGCNITTEPAPLTGSRTRRAAVSLPPAPHPTGGGDSSPAPAERASRAAGAGTTDARCWRIDFPAGMKLLSQNGRLHWAERNRRAQALKDAAIVLARQAKIPPLERVRIVVEYQPPDRRERDNDNIPAASGKYCVDGIVAAGVLEDDSSRYVLETSGRIGPVHPKGRLVLYVTEAPAETALGGAA